MEATPAGVRFVPARLMRRVIKFHRRLPGVGLDVPHAHAYAISRDELLALVEPEELGHRPEELPESILLVPRPDTDNASDRTALVRGVWRAAFHAAIHRELDAQQESGRLSPIDIAARIDAIGQTEFDEARLVLRQDHLLLPPETDASIYVEFAATFLELSIFDREALETMFPAISDPRQTLTVIRDGLDDRALLDATRPANAPSEEDEAPTVLAPPLETTATIPLAQGTAARVSPQADEAKRRGNNVRSVLLRARAKGTEHEVRDELETLMGRLAKTLQWQDAPVVEWAVTLLPLVHMASRAALLPWNVEGRILYDVQATCVDGEREIYTVGVTEWALSLGKKPMKRPLPSQRDVRIVRHLDAALKKLPSAKLPDKKRNPIAKLLHALRDRAERNMRDKLGPVLEEVLVDVGLEVVTAPETISKDKLVEELLDVIVAQGQISIGQLRDALSRSHVKMANLRLTELWKGDALISADQKLSEKLDGVYRGGEIYLRGLQKLSSVTFGTSVGRFLTLYLFLPVVGAYVAIEGLQHTVGLVIARITHSHPQFLTWTSFLATSVAIFLLIHVTAARVWSIVLLRLLGSLLKAVLLRFPKWVLERPLVRAILSSDPVVALRKMILRPAVFAAVTLLPLWSFIDNRLILASIMCAMFVAWNVVLNSRWGMVAEEVVTDWVSRRWTEFRRRFLPELFGLIAAFFRRALEVVDRFIYSVDERLRFQEGQSKAVYYGKAAAGVAWFVATYFVRIYVNLLLEPEVNPIKHVPVVTVAAKIMLPFTEDIHNAIANPLRAVLGPVLAESIAAPTVFLLPGFFGFLVWELKENWRLYSMNRDLALKPVVIGEHGETLSEYLRPGVHSGTVPKIFEKLRRALREKSDSRLKYTEELLEIREAIRRFGERELVPLLGEGSGFQGGPLEISSVDVASNRISISLKCPRLSSSALVVNLEEQSGYLVGGISRRSFIDDLHGRDRVLFENVLSGLYKLSGVDIVREQLAATIGELPYDISDEGLVVWTDHTYQSKVTYDLTHKGLTLPGRATHGLGVLPPVLDVKKVLFRDDVVLWTTWLEAWKRGAADPVRVTKGPSLFGYRPKSAEPSDDRTLVMNP